MGEARDAPMTHSFRQRLSEFLDDASREEARQIQNQILASIPRPPPDYWLLEDPRLRAGYLREFDPHPRYSRRHDIWFRYHAPEHLHRWSEFMLRHFPRCIQELEAAEAQQQAAPQQRRAWWKLW